MAKTTVVTDHGLRDPSSLVYQTVRTRRSILASYWVVIILAIPLWWRTTSIERLSLPSSRVSAIADEDLHFTAHVDLQLSGKTGATYLRNDTQRLLDERSLQAPHKWKGLGVYIHPKQNSDESGPGVYTVVGGVEEPTVQHRQLAFPWNKPDFTTSRLVDVLSALLVPYSAVPDEEYRVAQYSPRYRLAFTLLNEDAAAGNAVIGWDIPTAISRHVSPILDSLYVLHNFTIESQVQFHAPLAFKPHPVNNGYGLTPEDLTVFINSAEWTLSSSVSNDPVLHFVLFIPSASQRPLFILDAEGTPSSSNAFLVPQWGGIVIHNPPAETTSHAELSITQLDPIFTSFSNHLLALLGVPSLPVGIRSTSTEVLTDWQLDALLRRRALENARGSQDTLCSIVKLVDQIENMPVGQYVKGDVQDALTALDELYSLAPTSLALALQHSSRALTLASRAFFNPGMLALLYFPAEHKYAVYTPLFASAVIPLIGAALREFWAWSRTKKRTPENDTGETRPE